MSVFVELPLDVAGESEPLIARILAPQKRDEATGWVCRFEVGAPFDYSLDVHGESSMQALALALKGLSSVLYGSSLYEEGRLGHHGVFGAYLGLPASSAIQDVAPYPF